MSDYTLLSSSSTYRLPSGPFSDDSINMGKLRQALRSLGFKPKAISSIFTLIIAILELGNLQFLDGDQHVGFANAPVLVVSRLLGVSSEERATSGRILFAFVVETITHKLASCSKYALPASQIVILDQPGFQTRGGFRTKSISLASIASYGQKSPSSSTAYTFHFFVRRKADVPSTGSGCSRGRPCRLQPMSLGTGVNHAA